MAETNFTPQEIEEFLQQFFDVVGARQYVGARYVPIFGRAGEDTVEWDDLAPYEPLTVVMHTGISYVSRRYVPAGIQITDTAYWVETYRFNAQVEQYRQEVLGFQDEIDLRVPFPDGIVHPRYGTPGQVLATLGDGSTEWDDPVIVTSEIAGPIIADWLDDHPEATTTVEDGAVTTAKIADGAVTDAKMADGGIAGLVFDLMRRAGETAVSDEVTITGSMLIGKGLGSDGDTFDSARRATCMEYVYVAGIPYLRLTIESGYRLYGCFYDASQAFVSNFGWITADGYVAVPSSAAYVRFCKAVVDDTHTITEQELSNVRVWYANESIRDTVPYNGPIGANADLDSYVNAGRWSIPSASVATLAHAPSGLYGGTLEVTYGYTTMSTINNTAQVVQVITDPYTGAFHMRFASTGGEFRGWFTFDHALYDNALQYRNRLEAGADLDTVTTPGIYNIATAAGPSISHMPFAAAGGTLIVTYGYSRISSAVPGQPVQVFVSPYDNLMAMRFASTSYVWRDWLNVTGFAGLVPTGSDLNDYLQAGNYRVNIQSPTYQVTNMPPGLTGGSLIVSYGFNNRTGTNTGHSVQLMISPDDRAIAFRRSTNDGFTAWTVMHNDIVEPTRWLALGDSITYGVYSTGASSSAVGDGWPKQLCDSLGYTFYNAGVRGMGYVAVGGNGITIDDKLDEIEALTDSYNLVTIALGINDYNTSTVTIAQVEASLEDAVTRLQTKFPAARLLVITPFNACNHSDATTHFDLDYAVGGRTLRELATAIAEKCADMCVECINATEAFLFNDINIQGLELHGVHPSATAHHLIAKTMAHHLTY